MFFVNIADPPQIVAIEARPPFHFRSSCSIPVAGPHGLDLDTATGRLYCACDGMKVVTLDARTLSVTGDTDIGGSPDVIFLNAARHRLYVAIGDPGLIEVIDTDSMKKIQTVITEKGAHTLGFDPDRGKVYAFLPGTHRAAVYADMGESR